MAKFSYTGKDQTGNMTKGVIDAVSREEAGSLLGKNNITPIVISEEKKVFGIDKLNIDVLNHLSLSDKLMFCEEISTLINAGVPLAQSINIIREQSSKGVMRKIMDSLLKDIEGGKSLSDALEGTSKYFSPVFINMVRAGEASGTLDKALEELAIQTQKDHELVSKIKGALTYPVVILTAMVGAIIFLMVKVVPSISSLFNELDAKLPITTKMLIWLSNLMVRQGIFLALGTIFVVAGLYFAFHKIESLKWAWHKAILQMPVIGKISLRFNMARFARTLGTLLSSGVTVLEALEIVSHSTRNVVFSAEVEKVKEKVKNGAPIAEPLRQSKIFPIMVSQMLAVGEETGNSDKMLVKVAEFYERQIENFTKNISSIIEPVIMIIVGIAVGFVVVSIITPIYQATQSIK